MQETAERRSTRLTRIPDDESRPRIVVQRGVQGERWIESGEVIEVESIVRRRGLVTARLARPLEYGEEIWKCGCGRWWAGKDAATAHSCGGG